MIDNKPYYFNNDLIHLIGSAYSAIFVCETCIKSNDYWRNEPSMIFYSVKKHPDGSNYFAVSEVGGKLIISDGISAIEPFTGITANNGDIIYSRFRHDYRTSPDKSVSIDGGRDYTKITADTADQMKRTVTLQIMGPELVVV